MTKTQIDRKIHDILHTAEKDVEKLLKSENVKIYEDENCYEDNCPLELDGAGAFLAIYDNETPVKPFHFIIYTQDDMKNRELRAYENRLKQTRRTIENSEMILERNKAAEQTILKEIERLKRKSKKS